MIRVEDLYYALLPNGSERLGVSVVKFKTFDFYHVDHIKPSVADVDVASVTLVTHATHCTISWGTKTPHLVVVVLVVGVVRDHNPRLVVTDLTSNQKSNISLCLVIFTMDF
ncbi:hypothetical protein EVAR_53467_1 [Eumeta japonica]|uniref:Uncharacterized protein n=1 Tax=Eumeta variegata TaxID=151549 RepID=A0A4C1XTZ6_EUMVA|nr:hypothetical protein EVAR_53467_1 [Eumeta japonica]